MFLKIHSPAGNAEVRRYRGEGRAERNVERSERKEAPCAASEGCSQSTSITVSNSVQSKWRGLILSTPSNPHWSTKALVEIAKCCRKVELLATAAKFSLPLPAPPIDIKIFK